MSEYHPEMEVDKPFIRPFKSAEERFEPSWWDRLLGRDVYMNKLNHRNAYIQHLEHVNNTEVETLREGLLALDPDTVLAREKELLDDLTDVKEELRIVKAALAESQIAQRQAASEVASARLALSQAERAKTFHTEVPNTERAGLRSGRRSYPLDPDLPFPGRQPVPGSSLHSGSIQSTSPDTGSVLMQAAVLGAVLSDNSESSRSSHSRDSEPALCVPTESYSEPSRSSSWGDSSPSYSGDSGSSDGGGGGGGGD